MSAKAEYACVAMVELAAQYGKGLPVAIKAIAEMYNISPGFLIQILLQLKGAALVASSRGASGGYQLAQAPSAISLANIIDVIDGPPGSSSALSPLPGSAVVRVLSAAWQKAQYAERSILENLTLADLLAQAQESHELSYQI